MNRALRILTYLLYLDFYIHFKTMV